MHWIPLESNPEVLNEWSIKAGLAILQSQFTDVYGLDPELLAIVPKPVKAVILLFPAKGAIEVRRLEDDAQIVKDGQHPIDPSLIYIEQTIQNACGTIGLLHALINSDVTIKPESALAKFIDECQDKTPAERGKLLEKTNTFATIHLDAAQSGQTRAPSSDENVDLHFTCFVHAPSPGAEDKGSMRLIELDGRRGHPIDHGPSDDLLTDVAGVVKSKFIGLANDLHFSMVALAHPEN